MDTKNIVSAVELISNEKQVSKELIFKSLESALEVSLKKDIGKYDLIVNIDRQKGNIEVKKIQIVVEDKDFENDSQIKLSEVKNLKVGDVYLNKIEISDFSRVGAQVFKQIIKQNFKQATRISAGERYEKHIGDLFNATVKRVTKEAVYLTLNDDTEGKILLNEANGHFFKVGKKFRVVLDSVDVDNGHLLNFSLNSDLYVRAILKQEIPSIYDEKVGIVDIARIKGKKVKVVVKPLIAHVEAVRECIGHKGMRVKEVINALNGEQVDFVNYDSDLGQYIKNIMYPLSVVKVIIDEGVNKIYFSVSDLDYIKYEKSIKNYSDIASQLLGKKVIIKNETNFEEELKEKNDKCIEHLINEINVDEYLAKVLIEEGFDTVESILYSKEEDLLSIYGFDIDLVEEIKQMAFRSISKYKLNELMKIKSINIGIIEDLNKNGISTIEELAELSVYEFIDIIDIDDSLARKIIIEAREF